MCVQNDALLKLNCRPTIIMATRQVDSKDTENKIANNFTKDKKNIYNRSGYTEMALERLKLKISYGWQKMQRTRQIHSK